ncbi:hypothetical protein [Rhizobium sp. 18065]|uniref:hypothetical protein n=1 Tax=Rhizobium sp. 18065 TaxID=2681411 RepID=UPI001357C691|nr:hypothetical protein [Rhizobium sp. 18065]
MAVIKISAFAGERPLISPRLLPETAATAASNLRLDDGALTPINKPSVTLGSASDVGDQTIYLHGSDWLSWSSVVHASPGPVAADRLYYTGDGEPKMRVAGTIYPLALEPPASAPIVTISGTGSGDVVSRTYAWTWVTDFGEESAPSPISDLEDWQPGQTVTLSGFPSVPSGRNITKQRIYRSQTGSSGTYLYFIAERAASASDFVDTVAVDAFNEALPSAGWTPPPDDLSGLISMPNGMMAAFVGREVFFSEPYRPHAWPERYTMTCDSDVVGLCSLGSVLIVMTKANPYLMSGSHPDSMQSQKLEVNFGCINRRGIVDLGFAACYPAADGLVAIGADGSVSLATRQLFSREDWLALSPWTCVAGQHAGAYVLFYDTFQPNGDRYAGSLMINVGAGEYLVRSPEIAACVYFSSDEAALYFKPPSETNIYRFDDPDMPPDTYYWRSKEYWTTRPENFGAILVDLGDGSSLQSVAAIEAERVAIEAANQAILTADMLLSEVNAAEVNALAVAGDTLMELPDYDSIVINVYADRKLVRSITKAGSIDRLPAGSKTRLWEVSVSANVQVTQIIMAGTIDELRNMQ